MIYCTKANELYITHINALLARMRIRDYELKNFEIINLRVVSTKLHFDRN